MRIFKKSCGDPWFTLLQIGKKKVEGRLCVGDFSQMTSGDQIIFYNNNFNIYREFRCEITSIKKYSNFTEYLQKENVSKCLPSIDNIDDALKVYHTYFSKSDEERHGVVAIHIKVIKT